MPTLRQLCDKIDFDLAKAQAFLRRLPDWPGNPDDELDDELGDLVILLEGDPDEAEKELQKRLAPSAKAGKKAASKKTSSTKTKTAEAVETETETEPTVSPSKKPRTSRKKTVQATADAEETTTTVKEAVVGETAEASEPSAEPRKTTRKPPVKKPRSRKSEEVVEMPPESETATVLVDEPPVTLPEADPGPITVETGPSGGEEVSTVAETPEEGIAESATEQPRAEIITDDTSLGEIISVIRTVTMDPHAGSLAESEKIREEAQKREEKRQEQRREAEQKEKQVQEEEARNRSTVVPDPDVVRRVIEQDRLRRAQKEREERLRQERAAGRAAGRTPVREGTPRRPGAATPPAGRGRSAAVVPPVATPDVLEVKEKEREGERKKGKLTKAERKKKSAERARVVEENLRREAELAVREFQSGISVMGGKRRRKRRRDEDDGSEGTLQERSVIEIEDVLTVEQLANVLGIGVNDLILHLMDHNILATKNQVLDLDTIRKIADEYNCDVELAIPEEEELLREEPDPPEKLRTRPPVVTVMGHVDHGKTSLLDRIRKTNVAEQEAGGITQHIAAYQVTLPTGGVVTFLDTPGHEAFTQMRARGANVTDIVVLVVAANDGIMPQTVEAINHAKAANATIVVAINKCDLADAQPDRVRQELTQYGLLDEAWGGNTIMRNISAKTGAGVQELVELLSLQAEMLELRANPDKPARGAVLESEITTGQGPVAWVLVQSGTLRVGDAFVAGATWGRVRSLYNDRNEEVQEAGPSMPVAVTGFSAPPEAGDQFIVVAEERKARIIAEKREAAARLKRGPAARHMTLEDFHQRMQGGEHRELRLVIKADVQGSVDVLRTSFAKMGNEEVQVQVVHAAVGAVNESDVLLADVSDAVIIGFHVTANPKARKLAEELGVEIRTFQIIYEALDEVKKALEGLLAPEQYERITGHAEIRQVFRSSAVGNIAGCYVLDGEITRGGLARLIRDGVIIHDGRIESLKRMKEDARTVSAGYECGIRLERYDDIREGDIIETYVMESRQKTLN
ncbi:MAG TPA: translation initiation factor IF-2 [Candidatus Hydrogenedentes bacterium]|nr:translation initiation factor IF-2 [Candidatus Hydrogenedentota bacterium]HOV60253.1 translation initiation factor IF-2 [Candidatus Hydrogenedentota bacterium]